MGQGVATFNAIVSPNQMRLVSLLQSGRTWFVDPVNGNNASGGPTRTNPVRSVQYAANRAEPGDIIAMLAGSYNEAVVLPRTLAPAITLLGLGARGSVAIAPSATNATALVNDTDNLRIENVGLAGVGSGQGLINTGSRLQLLNSKLENDDGTGFCATMTMGTVAQQTAGTKGNGADCLIQGCEFAWAASGINITCTDYGAITELRVVDNLFHDVNTKHILETVGSGGSAAVMYASLFLKNNVHMDAEDGTAPTAYVDLNGDNANTGIACGNVYPEASNGGLVLFSTKLISVGNYFTGGLSTGQPS